MIIKGREIRTQMKRDNQDVHKGQILRTGGVGIGGKKKIKRSGYIEVKITKLSEPNYQSQIISS